MVSPELILNIQIALLAIGIVCILVSLKIWLSYKNKRKFVSHKRAKLTSHSIDELTTMAENEKSSLLMNIEKGKPFFEEAKSQIKALEEQTSHILAGLAPPVFKLDDSESLKNSIKEHRKEQYLCIKNRNATRAISNWTWFGDARAGTQMVSDYQTLLLKAFNDEFEVIRKQMRVHKIKTAYEKISRLCEALYKLGETAGAEVTPTYVQLKLNELHTWHQELLHKEEKKIARKQEQQAIRNQNKLNQLDTESLDDAIAVRESDLKKAKAKAEQLAGAELAKITKMIQKITDEKAKLEEKLSRALSQAQITRSGYVYVISNRGSFGKGVLKIGMTRRLEPMDRVNELGDASVPFKFAVHTLAYVDNAPGVEKALHNKFNDRRVNIENEKKEFFRVSVAEVKQAMEAMSIESDWYFSAEAKEYDESMLIIAAEEKQHKKQFAEENETMMLPESI